MPSPTPTPTTTPVPAYTVVDFGDASATVGQAITNAAGVNRSIPGGRVSMALFDTNQASDGGYSWSVLAVTFGPPNTYYSIIQVRARASLGGTTYRLDFDGATTSRFEIGLVDVPGPWDLANGDKPTLTVESITIDLTSPL